MAIGRLPHMQAPPIYLQSHAKGLLLWTASASTGYLSCEFVPAGYLDSLFSSVRIDDTVYSCDLLSVD